MLGWRNWTFFLRYNATRSVSGLFAWSPSVGVADALEALVVLGAVIIGVRAVLRGMPPEGAAALAFAAFLLVNKVYSPQYMLWMVVMALIAGWPGWTIIFLSVSGLFDYFGTFGALYLDRAPAHLTPAANKWAADVLNISASVLRYGAIAAVRSRSASGGRPPGALERHIELSDAPVNVELMGAVRVARDPEIDRGLVDP